MRELLSERFALVDDEFASAVLDGLSRPQKTLPCRFFYDARGSELFEEITRLPEYYPTRTEAAILEAHAAEMAEGDRRRRRAGRVRLGLEPQDRDPAAASCRSPAPTCRSTSRPAALDGRQRSGWRRASRTSTCGPSSATSRSRSPSPPTSPSGHKTGFFPGSTIGNLTPIEAGRLLAVLRNTLSPGGRLIVGVDLKKDLRKLLPAYNDAAGVTAAFNLNLLARINRELGGTFDLDGFRHEAIYNARDGRIEMHLVSRRDQDVDACAAAASASAPARPSTPRTPTSTRSASSRTSRAPPAGGPRACGPTRPTSSACTSSSPADRAADLLRFPSLMRVRGQGWG